MKRILSLSLALLLSVYVYAQQDHLTFKNIPITGSMSSFITKMKAAGFTLQKQEARGAIMKGPFAGYSDCQILIGCSPKTQTVWKVAAYLPDQSSWSSVESRYKEFKQRYTDKYGIPNDSYEFFTDSYYDGDGYELQAIKLEKGYYVTYWKIELGIIAVGVGASSNSKGWVELWYEDKAGTEIMDKERTAIVNDDI